MGIKESFQNYRERRRVHRRVRETLEPEKASGWWVTAETFPLVDGSYLAPSSVSSEAANKGAALAGKLKSPLQRQKERQKGKHMGAILEVLGEETFLNPPATVDTKTLKNAVKLAEELKPPKGL